jgi:hypothetical protein
MSITVAFVYQDFSGHAYRARSAKAEHGPVDPDQVQKHHGDSQGGQQAKSNRLGLAEPVELAGNQAAASA